MVIKGAARSMGFTGAAGQHNSSAIRSTLGQGEHRHENNIHYPERTTQ
jgi:hypothetical protein